MPDGYVYHELVSYLPCVVDMFTMDWFVVEHFLWTYLRWLGYLLVMIAGHLYYEYLSYLS